MFTSRTPAWLTPAALLVTAGLLLAGCGDDDAGGGDGGDVGSPDAKWTLGMSQANLAEPYRVQMDQDIRDAAQEAGDINVTFKDAQKDSQRQRSHVEEFINQGVDLILISPNEPAPLSDPVTAAVEAGIPVVVLDRRLDRDAEFTTFIGADNYEIGKAAGQWIVNKLGGEGKVVELKGMMSTDPALKRHQGFRDAIAGSNIEIIFEADMEWDQTRAGEEMESALSVADDIDLVYAHNDPGARGAYLAADRAGRADDILFVGIDALEREGQAWVREGILDASFEYPTGGAKAVEIAQQILAGEDVPKEVVLPSRFFTPENVADGGADLSEIEGYTPTNTAPTNAAPANAAPAN